MSNKIKYGVVGENLAVDYLVREGYDILSRNFRHQHSEIDIVASKDNILVFVEVKARSSKQFGNPEEAVNEKKIKKVLEGAEHYIFKEGWKGRIRFDIIAVDLQSEEITHFEDAFG